MQRCSEKAYAMCPTRHLCGTIDEATFTDDSECAAFNQKVDNMPMTNADRIRAMSDEELVAWAIIQIGCGFDSFPCGVVCDGKCETYNSKDCEAKILKWLRQPVEDKENVRN